MVREIFCPTLIQDIHPCQSSGCAPDPCRITTRFANGHPAMHSWDRGRAKLLSVDVANIQYHDWSITWTYYAHYHNLNVVCNRSISGSVLRGGRRAVALLWKVCYPFTPTARSKVNDAGILLNYVVIGLGYG